MEAHAEDEWPVGTVVPEDEDLGTVSLKQPTHIEDRYQAAKALNRDLPLGNNFRFLVDTIDNSFNNSYSSWPFRCWIVDENGKIAYMSQPPPNGVAEDLSVTELTAWIEAFQQ